jgi:hypothetical protein
MEEQAHATTEIIAEFASAAEANEALARLRAEGIEGMVAGDVPTAPNFAIVDPQQFVPITVAVTPADVERARQVLAGLPAVDEEVSEEELAEDAKAAITGWICPSCDTEVPQDVAVCPECATPRPEGAA